MAETYKSVIEFYDLQVGDKLKEITIDVVFTNKELAEQSTKNWINFYKKSLDDSKYKIEGRLVIQK